MARGNCGALPHTPEYFGVIGSIDGESSAANRIVPFLATIGLVYAPHENITFLGNTSICTNGTAARKLVLGGGRDAGGEGGGKAQ